MSNGKKKYKVKKNAGVGDSDAYPFTACTTRYRSGKTGRLVKTPQSAKPKGGRATTKKGKVGGLIVTRSKVDGEVMGAKVIHGDMRQAQRRGKVTKTEVRELEKDLSRDALATFAPRLAQSVELEKMHEAHRSSKSKRGAETKKRNAPHKKKADPVQLRTKMHRIEQLVKDAERRHAGAKSITTKSKHADTLRKRKNELAKVRAELRKVGG